MAMIGAGTCSRCGEITDAGRWLGGTTFVCIHCHTEPEVEQLKQGIDKLDDVLKLADTLVLKHYEGERDRSDD